MATIRGKVSRDYIKITKAIAILDKTFIDFLAQFLLTTSETEIHYYH